MATPRHTSIDFSDASDEVHAGGESSPTVPQLMAAAAGDCFLFADGDDIVRHVLGPIEDVSGWHRDDVVGCRLADFILTEDQTALAEVIAGIIGGDNPGRTLLRIHRPGGGFTWIVGLGEVVRWKDGAPDLMAMMWSRARVPEHLLTHPAAAGDTHRAGEGDPGRGDHRPVCPLTQRQRDVLNALTQGLRNAEIARGLHLEESTVKFHLTRIFRELGVNNRAAAIIRARDLGWVDPPS